MQQWEDAQTSQELFCAQSVPGNAQHPQLHGQRPE